ncbi:MAG TPA: hypothetical protein VGB85_09495 [Nannocystis sp.]|jgi:hypothetical protein
MIALALHLTFGTALFQEGPASEAPPAPVEPAPAPGVPEPAPAPEAADPLAPAPVAEPFAVSATPDVPPKPRRFVFAFLPGVTAGVSRLPSLDFAFFFGGRLPRSPWALGYQFTLSSGLAERYPEGLMTHRHHLTAMRSFGARDRGFVSIGGGVAVLAVFPVVEAETRLGFRFGARRRGVVAGLARIGWNVAYREQAPMPQLGVVLGVALF